MDCRPRGLWPADGGFAPRRGRPHAPPQTWCPEAVSPHLTPWGQSRRLRSQEALALFHAILADARRPGPPRGRIPGRRRPLDTRTDQIGSPAKVAHRDTDLAQSQRISLGRADDRVSARSPQGWTRREPALDQDGGRRRGRRRPGGTQQTRQARQQLSVAEGLCQIVARTERQGAPNIVGRIACGQHHHWNVGHGMAFLDVTQHREPIHAGHVDIKDNDVWTRGVDAIQRLKAVTAMDRVIASKAKARGHQIEEDCDRPRRQRSAGVEVQAA